MKQLLFFLLFPLALSAQIEGALEDSLQEVEVEAVMEYTEEDIILEESYERAPYNAPPLAPVALRELRSDDWGKATEGLDYSKDLPKPPKDRKKRAPDEPSPSFDWAGLTQGLGSLLQILAVVFALGILSYGIYWMMQVPRNRSISRDGTEITLANLDEYIHETDLERFLREALAVSNWPLAVRLYYLQAIKHLSEKGSIVWSKEKTNHDYLREMRSHALGGKFRGVTRHYERVWYGNQALSAEEFAQLEIEFQGLLGSVRNAL